MTAVVTADPAAADVVDCSSNQKDFNLPNKPDVTVTVNLCIIRETAHPWNLNGSPRIN
jgi:hypothetical protein